MNEKLKWKFDSSTFKLLGRGLITDRITAMYELVKNCYDANAIVVDIDFYEVQIRNTKSKIIVRDNGQGMSLIDIKDKWLVVGTSNKRKNEFSPAPFKRRYIGEKGVGRFATDKLGKHLIIRTKQKNDSQILEVTINWEEYEKQTSTEIQSSLFTDLENEYRFIADDGTFSEGHGTELCITALHEAWDKEMILRLENQLTRIISPTNALNPPFLMYLTAFEHERKKIIAEPIEELATVHVKIASDYENGRQGVLSFNNTLQNFETVYIEPKIFGLINLEFYYFNAEAQTKFKAKYKHTQNFIEGVKIYRDGVICTPFAEYERTLDNRRDILGIDKRRHQEAFDKLSTREVIGIVEITKNENPDIIDATNRQDFIDNEAYRTLKDFIINQLDELAKYKLVRRDEKKQIVQNNLKKASSNIKEVEKELKRIVKDNPKLKDILTNVVEKSEQTTLLVASGVKQQKEVEKEFLRKENLYLSLMSLQDFASGLAHGIRFILTPVKHASEFFLHEYPNEKYQVLFKKYASMMFGQTEKASTLIDFMLSYSQTVIEESTFSIKELLEDLMKGAYSIVFQQEDINIDIAIMQNIEFVGNRKFIEDVLSNLISNAIKALKETQHKIIKCESYIEQDYIHILFSDNGTGIDDKIKNDIFEIFKTSTAEQGGTGLGLFIAKTRMGALGGTIVLIDSIFAPIGTTLKLSIPLKNPSI